MPQLNRRYRPKPRRWSQKQEEVMEAADKLDGRSMILRSGVAQALKDGCFGPVNLETIIDVLQEALTFEQRAREMRSTVKWESQPRSRRKGNPTK